MSARYLVVATKEELYLPIAKKERNRIPIVTGVGGTNVIKALRNLPRNADILNVGYCGSPCFPVGEVICVQYAKLLHPGVHFNEETFELKGSSCGVTCLTSGDFVTDPHGLPPNSIVDMELAYIAAFGFENTSAVKYVSDNLNLNEYETCLKK